MRKHQTLLNTKKRGHLSFSSSVIFLIRYTISFISPRIDKAVALSQSVSLGGDQTREAGKRTLKL